MKGGAENRRKTITAGALGAVALCCLLYAYNTFFGGASAPVTPPSLGAASTSAPPARAANRPASTPASAGRGSVAGVPAAKLATTAAALDPTLDQAAMLRTENLLYSGSGRNIFSAEYVQTSLPVKLPTHVPPARPQAVVLPAAHSGPAPPPPINLKFFGTATRSSGSREAFLLAGEDVYLASAGEIVARKYKIVQIAASSILVQDLQTGNTQNLPLQIR